MRSALRENKRERGKLIVLSEVKYAEERKIC